MIQINNASFSYKNRKIFSDFSLHIEQGKIYGLLGQNGVGKSTLLYLMSGLLFPQQGEVLVLGKDVTKRLPITLSEIFIIPEEFDLPAVSLSKYVKLNKVFYPKFDESQMHKYLNCFGMSDDIMLNALSMGQKKKVYMSFALATNTSIVLMDEPTNGLDIPSKSQFRKFLAMGMTDERTIVISTHQVQDVENMLDQLIIMDEKSVILNESVSNITQKIAFISHQIESALEDNVLYSQPTTFGNLLMVENKNDLDTPINIEVFYNSLIQNREAVLSIFKTKNDGNF